MIRLPWVNERVFRVKSWQSQLQKLRMTNSQTCSLGWSRTSSLTLRLPRMSSQKVQNNTSKVWRKRFSLTRWRTLSFRSSTSSSILLWHSALMFTRWTSICQATLTIGCPSRRPKKGKGRSKSSSFSPTVSVRSSNSVIIGTLSLPLTPKRSWYPFHTGNTMESCSTRIQSFGRSWILYTEMRQKLVCWSFKKT